MPISVSCACGHQLRAKDQFAGKTVKCPKCGKGLLISGPAVPACDVFLSYSSKDKVVADAACAALEARGIRCWIAPRDIIAGKEWGAAIIEGLEQCQSMVLIFSANANTSQQVMREVERAVHRGMPIIPFRIEDVPASKSMEYFISFHHWMDAFDGTLDEHLEQLSDTVRSLVANQPATAGRAHAQAPAAATPRRVAVPSPPSSGRGLMGLFLVLGLALLLVGGGAAGFYIWSNQKSSNAEKTQPTENKTQIAQAQTPSSNRIVQPTNTAKQSAQGNSQPPKVKGNDSAKENQQPKDENKQSQPPKTSPKVEPTVPTAAYSEDLRSVEVGDQPKGWKCDSCIALFKGQDQTPYLHATKAGNHSLTTPDLGLRGDFFIEFEFEMGPGHLLEAALLAQDGSAGLTLKVDAGGGGNPADVHFQDSAPRYILGLDGTTKTRLRVERERTIYRVSLNGKVTHARRLSGFKDFAGVRFTLPGEPQIGKLYSFRAGPIMAQKVEAAPDTATPAELFRKGFNENFKNTVAGDLPPGWEGDDAIGVRLDGVRPRLEGCQDSKLTVKLPLLDIRGDFFLECEFELATYQSLEVKLVGRDGGGSLPIKVDPGGGGTPSTVYFPEGSSIKVPQTAGMIVPLRIERKGEVYRINLNNILAHAGRFEGCADFERVDITFSGGTNSAKVYSIRLGPMGSK
jgi:TIR domain